MIALFGIPAPVVVAMIVAVYAMAGLLWCALMYRPKPVSRSLPEPKSASDVDNWLAAEEPLLEFKVWKRPETSARLKAGL